MLPAGLGFNAVSEKALAASRARAAAALLLGLGADHRGQRGRLLALHVGDEPAVRAARGDRDAARGRPRERVRPPPPACRGDARGRARVGPRGPVPGRARVLGRADGGRRAGRRRRRRGAAGDPRALRHVARRGARQARRARVPDRPPRRLQRPDAGRDAVRRRDGPAARRRAGRPRASTPRMERLALEPVAV